MRDGFAHLLLHAAEKTAPAAAPALSGHGRIDFFGFHTPAHGWFFCGWVIPEHLALDDRAQAIAYFEQGSIAAPAVMSSHFRDDLTGTGIGLVLFVEGSGRPMGSLISLSIIADGASWTLLSRARPR